MYGSCGNSGFEIKNDGLRHCNYCGSIHPEDLYNLLVEGKVVLGGSDWKYGYPHKFYIYTRDKDLKLSGGKFYSNHLIPELLDDQTFNKIISTINTASGITFERKDEGLFYSASYRGYQKSTLG